MKLVRAAVAVSCLGVPITSSAANWSVQPSGASVDLTDVQFLDASQGWITGKSGTVLKTTDGGSTWLSKPSGVTVDLIAIDMLDASTGWIAGRSGTVLKTTDGGESWAPQTSGTVEWLHGVLFLDASTGWINGMNGTIRKTTDGGVTWNAQASGTTNTIVTIVFIDGSNGWGVGQNEVVLRTTDAGASWTTISLGSFYVLEDVHFANALDGWTVGRSGITRRTTDGGVTWANRFVPNGWLKGLEFTGPSTAWAMGTAGAIFWTTDAGATWNPDASGVSVDLWKSSFPRPEHGWVVGRSGTILTVDGITDAPAVREPPDGGASLGLPTPTPFRDGTTVSFTLGATAGSRLAVFDVTGRRLTELSSRSVGPGEYTATWNGHTDAGGIAPPGVYFLRLTTASGSLTRRVVRAP